jgi:hypothetical protein
LLVAIAACSSKQAPRDAAPPPPPPPADAAAATDAEATSGKITFSVKPAHPKGTALGKRCAIDGEPLVGECSGGSEGLAIDAKNTLWVTSGASIRRYTRGEACHYVPDGVPFDLPPVDKRMQPLDKGPVYMRSGGPAWHLLRAGDAIYAYDYLGGMFRVDRGKPEPVCLDVFGYDSAAFLDGKIYIARQGIEELVPGKKCVAKSAKIDDKAHGKLAAIRGKLYLASRDNALMRAEPKKLVDAAPTAKPCSIWATTACGDSDACMIDGNCKRVIQVGDGDFERVLEQDSLFEPVPWSIVAAATWSDGAVVTLARVREGHGPEATCEGAIYELPPALFAR